MQRISLQFDLSDKDLVDFIASSTPPEGITIDKPKVLIKAGGESGGIFYQVVFFVATSAVSVGLNILASWLYDCCNKSGSKKGRVNGNEIIFNKASIDRLIKRQLANDHSRDAQRRTDKHCPSKKR